MWNFNLFGNDNGGNKSPAGVTPEGGVCVAEAAPFLPKIGSPSKLRFFSGLLGSTGLDSGTTNMNVDGSSTEQKFFISASPDYDLKITALVIIIADTTIAHNKFGGVAALTNGWELKIIENGADTFIIKDAKTSGQVIVQSALGHPYGAGATSFQLTKWTDNDDAHTAFFPMHDIIPGGARIGRGTKDQIVSTVKDDVTGLTEFTVRVLGYRHFL